MRINRNADPALAYRTAADSNHAYRSLIRSMKTNAERFNGLTTSFQAAIIDRLALQAVAGELAPSAPILRVAAIGAWKEVAGSEADPIDGELAANCIFGVLAINESAFTQKLERLADAGQLAFKIKRGKKAVARGYTQAD